nr:MULTISPECIES: hypothetical protein [Thiorhodovibrio]
MLAKMLKDGKALMISNTLRTGGCKCMKLTLPSMAFMSFLAFNSTRIPALLM